MVSTPPSGFDGAGRWCWRWLPLKLQPVKVALPVPPESSTGAAEAVLELPTNGTIAELSKRWSRRR